jgi:hypothetical protein
MQNTYYGRPAPLINKQNGVYLLMLDEHIAQLVDKHIERFQREIEKTIKDAISEIKEIKYRVIEIERKLAIRPKKDTECHSKY